LKEQNKKFCRIVIGGGVLCLLLLVPGIIIARAIFGSNQELFKECATYMLFITLAIYMLVAGVAIIKYDKYVRNYRRQKIEKASKELTTEFKPVYLKYSEPISKKYFDCEARIDDDGKIFCKVHLDREFELENHEEFLRFFSFEQD